MSNITSISISQRYKSSTRIDTEISDYKPFINDFILHGTAVNVLDTISRDFSGSAQRAYTLTGPYGSGKSTVALFMSSLLSSNKSERNYANAKLDKADGVLDEFSSRFAIKKGWQVIKHVCGLESPAHAILVSIYKALNIEFQLEEIKAFDDDECLSEIKLALASKPQKYDGILLFLDEMGKALDYQSRNNKDLHFFQSLADIAQQAKSPVLLMGFLHQSFSEYAKNKDAKAQKEWAKVQGRYRDLGFNPTIDESLVLVGDSISKAEKIKESLQQNHGAIIDTVIEAFEHKNTKRTALLNTLPIDPVVGLLLGPISRRRFSQNERSLFGFLASHEKLGFREFLHEHYIVNEETLKLYHPEQLWDYLHFNLHHLIVTSHDSKAWLEGCDAIYRASQKGNDLHVAITKVIALLTIFGFQHQLHATKSFLKSYFIARGVITADFDKAVADLEAWSVVIYRQNHNALFIFQGSDIDIHNLVIERIESVSKGVDWTQICDIPQNIMATAHYHKTGTMRWANTKLVSSLDETLLETLKQEPLRGASLVSFIIPTNEDVAKLLEAKKADFNYAAIGKPASLELLKSLSIELIALKQIAAEEENIAHDLIAQKELDTRIQITTQQIETELSSVFESSEWFYQGTKVKGKSLSKVSSEIADYIYHSAPVVINELVNRSKPSGSANSAIKKLLLRMVDYADEQDLGFESSTFPPEKGLYLSCLVKKGLHSYDSKNKLAEFEMPTSDNSDVKVLFDVALEHLKAHQNQVVHLSDIYELWGKKPFGVSKGVLAIWTLAFILANTEHLAFYDKDLASNDIFISHPDEEFANKLIKEPQNVGVKFIAMDGMKLSHLNSLAKALNTSTLNASTLKIAQEYVQFVSGLSPWTKKTTNLSKLARGFRDLTLVASDPTKYLVEDIPKLFSNNNVEVEADKISEIIDELRTAHLDMVNAYKARITSFFTLDEHLHIKCLEVKNYTSDYKLGTFALRLTEFASHEKWVSSIISLLSGVAERNWNDMSIEKANSELVQIIDKFKAASHYAVLGDLTTEAVDAEFEKEISTVVGTLGNIENAKKRAILLRVLESLEKENI
jgi:energy-coupling factor transporter ATP-binding protein EcfA2